MDRYHFGADEHSQRYLPPHSEMKLLEVIKDDAITLEDCMQAQEIND